MRPKLGTEVVDIRTGQRVGWIAGGGNTIAVVRSPDKRRLRIYWCWLRQAGSFWRKP